MAVEQLETAPPQLAGPASAQPVPTVREAGADYFVEPHHPSIEEMVNRLAELLAGLDDDGRTMASTALSNLVKQPERGAAKAAEMLATIERLHPREPQPDPTSPTPTRAGEAAAAARWFPGMGNLRAEVLAEATAHCRMSGRELKVLRITESQPPYILGNYPRADLEFTCTLPR